MQLRRRKKIGEWTALVPRNPLQSESVPPTQGQSWAEQPNPSTSRAESEFDPVQGPFPDWEGSPPPPSKNRRKILYVCRLDCSVALPAPGLFEAGAGHCGSISLHLLVASQHAQAQQQRSPCYLCGKMLAAGDHWARTQHSRFLSRKKARARSKSASPSNKWLGRRWMARPCHCQWSRLLELEWEAEPANNSDSYQVAGAWRWGQHEMGWSLQQRELLPLRMGQRCRKPGRPLGQQWVDNELARKATWLAGGRSI